MTRYITAETADGKEKVVGHDPAFDPEVRRVMREAFSGTSGRRALSVLLHQCGLFGQAGRMDHDDTIRSQTLRDFGVWLLELTGAYHEGNIQAVVDHLMDLPVREDETTKEGT